MPRIVNLSGHAKPSKFMLKLRAARKAAEEVSESSKGEILAKRWVLGKRVHFYTNGDHIIKSKLAGYGLTKQEQYDSELLRYCHASILISQPVGVKEKIWVDASDETKPVEIWIAGKPVKQLLEETKQAVSLAQSIDCANFLALAERDL